MDLNIAISKIYPDAKYRLSQADPPHEIIEWRDERREPTPVELRISWEEHEFEEQKKDEIKANVKANGITYYLIDSSTEEVREITLLKKEVTL
jgi:uncharacterized lipoprotein YbaY